MRTPAPNQKRNAYMSDETPIGTAAAMEVAAPREALRAFLRESELIVQANGLTPQRHLLLLMIKGAPDGSERSTVTELAARPRLAQTTVTDPGQASRRCRRARRDSSPHCQGGAPLGSLLPRTREQTPTAARDGPTTGRLTGTAVIATTARHIAS
jgi:hypothetical protein